MELTCKNCTIDLEKHSLNDIDKCMVEYAHKSVRKYRAELREKLLGRLKK